MSLYHFSLGHVSRGAGQGAVASAAYISGGELYSEYYGEWSDYTRKGGVIYTEIILPENAPKEFLDRETLWNSVEKVEKNKRAQLAYNFNIALQNELSTKDNIELARAFIMENFVSRGMICDFAVHEPEKKDGGIPNPHFHVMIPVRPLDKDGKWGAKQHREYLLDEAGNRIRKPNGEYDFISVPTTDWGDPETLKEWRRNWADMVNSKFEEKGLECRIDNRSYAERGIDKLPTIHEGPAVRAMEKKGIRTRKGDLNRWIKKANDLVKRLKDELVSLRSWIKELKETIDNLQHKDPMVIDYIDQYFDNRNQGAYSQKAKINNLKSRADAYNFLTANNITTLDSLDALTDKMVSEVSKLFKEVKAKDAKIKDIEGLLKRLDQYEENKPFFDEKYKIRNKSDQDAYSESHRRELTIFNAARRVLKESNPTGNIPNRENLERKLDALYDEYDSLHEQYHEKQGSKDNLKSIRRMIDSVNKDNRIVSKKEKVLER